MVNRIPVPTDDIYKFYALFGLVLFVFSMASVLYLNRSSNQVIFDVVPTLEALKEIENPTASQTIETQLLERKLEITLMDKKAMTILLGVVAGFGVILSFTGFKAWHAKVQPLVDQISKTQLELLELQVRELRYELTQTKDDVSSEPGSDKKDAS